MFDTFGKYADYFHELNEKRERVVKASRDVTINSKKVIFEIHRLNKTGLKYIPSTDCLHAGWNCLADLSPSLKLVLLIGYQFELQLIEYGLVFGKIGRNSKGEVLDKAEKNLALLADKYVSRLVKELQGTDFWRLRKAYAFGVQEFVEAATFCKFSKTGTLLSLDEINATLLPLSYPFQEPLQLNLLDYLLGIADLTGELMRLAIGRVSDGELEFSQKICMFVRDIYRELTLIVPLMDEESFIKPKMNTMLCSVVKIENACFGAHLRGSEFMSGTSEPGSFLVGIPNIELSGCSAG